MASPPTSARLRLLHLDGRSLDAPPEWMPALIEVRVAPEHWAEAQLWLQERRLQVSLRKIDGTPRVLADWPRAGPGRYRLRLEAKGAREDLVLAVQPGKIS